MNLVTLCIGLSLLLLSVEGSHRCVWVTGVLRCNKNEKNQMNVEVRVYDRDGFSVFQAIDPDDLMGVTFTEADGTFKLDGCGDDFDWFPGVPNLPEPYIQIRHYCNNEKGETIRLKEFSDFVPNTHDIGVLVLDDANTEIEPKNLPTDAASEPNRSIKKPKVTTIDEDNNVITHPDGALHHE